MPDHLEVAVENSMVCNIKSDQRRIQSDICLGNVIAEKARTVAWLTEMLFQAIQGFENGVHVLLVRLLTPRETGLVDTIVDGIVDPFVHRFNVLAQMAREDALFTFACFS